MFNIEVQRKSKKAIKAIIINLNEHSLRFNGDAQIRLERTNTGKDIPEPNLFTCFNEYVEKTFDTDRKVELFKLYEKAYLIAESPILKDYNIELAQLKPIVTSIIEYIDPDKFKSFIQYSNHLIVPPELEITASKGDYPSQTTITDYDYRELVKTTFVIRVIYPIIFSLISRFSTTMGVGYSELVCGNLIKDNPTITNMYGWEKLHTYANFAFHKLGIPQQVDAVGSVEYFIDRVVYNTIFSRLCCAVIPETEEGKNIANAINAAVQQHKSSGNTFRRKDDRTEGEEDKRSLIERYRINEEIKAADEVAAAEFFSMGLFDEDDQERHKDRFKHAAAALNIQDVALVERVYDNIPPAWDFQLDDHVIKLLQLTFYGDIPPMIYWACNYYQLMAAVALAQVRLNEWGYHYLPSVLGAVVDPEGMRSLPDGLKLNTEDKEFLSSICDIQSRNDEGRSFNEAIEAATTFLDHFGNGAWKSNLEYAVLSDPKIYQRVEKGALFSLEIEVEIKNEFIRLIRQIVA